MKVGVIGLGKLGAPMVACLAEKHQVIATDIDAVKVAKVATGMSPVDEPTVQQLLRIYKKNVTTTIKIKDVAMDTDVIFVVVPTPSSEDGTFYTGYIENAFLEIADAISLRTDYPVVAVVSTVSPGSMAKLKRTLERFTCKECGKGFGLVYNPEFIALGTVVRDFMSPDFVLIGQSDEESGRRVEKVYREMNVVPIRRMSMENAEITKLALNCFVTMKISFANFLSLLCEKVKGGDVDVITGALGMDHRIGTPCLRGGAPFGGPCFPRDDTALIAFAKSIGVMSELPRATVALNKEIRAEIGLKVIKALGGRTDAKVAMLGLAYKCGTGLQEESLGRWLVDMLKDYVTTLWCVDPCVDGAAPLEQAVKDADVIVITQPNYEYRKVEDLAERHQTVIDCWRLLDPLRVRAEYVVVGRG